MKTPELKAVGDIQRTRAELIAENAMLRKQFISVALPVLGGLHHYYRRAA